MPGMPLAARTDAKKERLGKIEVGLGGDRSGLRGQTLKDQLEHLKELMAAYDPEAKIEFLEARPSPDRAQEECRVASDLGMPFKQFTDLYVIGGNDQQPDALVTLETNLRIAQASGSIERLNMQIWGDNQTPSVDELLRFYLEAQEKASKAGVELYTETHIERFTYDPRRLVGVHEALTRRTGNGFGLKVAADFSHYVHQIGNTKMANWEAIKSGELNLDPFHPNNYVSRNIIEKGMIGYAHLRMAAPNNLGDNEGTIQYPLVDPKLDTLVKPNPKATLKSGPFDASRQRAWKEWYRQIFAYQLRHPERPVLRASSEFIGNGQPGRYRVDDYSNLFQNIAMVSWAQKFIRQLQGELPA